MIKLEYDISHLDSENVNVPCNSSERDCTTLIVGRRDEIETSNIHNPSEISFWSRYIMICFHQHEFFSLEKCLDKTDGISIESAAATSMIDLIEENTIPSGTRRSENRPKCKVV